MKLTVKRQFAVILEDAFAVEVPDDTNVSEWLEGLDGEVLYSLATDPDNPNVRLLWEDEHGADLDFPEESTFVEDETGTILAGSPA